MMTLDQAVAVLRAMAEPTTSDAAALLLGIERPGQMRLMTPLRRCKGRACPVTPIKRFLDLGCCCIQPALALRLLERARDLSSIAAVAPPERFTRRCAACRLPFSTTSINQRYCPPCLGLAKRKKRKVAA
jgi:hypothetical protein